MTKIIVATDFYAELVRNGLIPENTRRVIIDAQAGGCVMLMYETFAEPAIINAILDAGLRVKESDV